MAGKLRRMTTAALALFLAALFNVTARAANEPEFRLDMDSLNLQTGVSANMVVSMINAQGAQIIGIEGIDGFDVMSQTRSTSTSIVNGETTYQEDVYYTLMPNVEGQFTIIAYVEYDGDYYATEALRVTVGGDSSNAGGQAPDLFMRTAVSHTEAYIGEKVVLTYELYTRINIRDYGFTEYIAIDGVVATEMPDDGLVSEYVYIDGERYIRHEVKKIIIDPIKPGDYTIPAFNFQVNVATGGGPGGMGGIGGFFNMTVARPVYLQTEAARLNVLPLPQEGRPADFSGVVGVLELHGEYSRTSLNYGDSLNLEATAGGNCNLDPLTKLTRGDQYGFSIYETRKNSSEHAVGNTYYSEKVFGVIYVPEKTGTLTIDPIELSYFNPVTRSYELAVIPGAEIEVLGSMPQPGAGGYAPSIETVSVTQVNYSDVKDGYFKFEIKKENVYITAAALAVLAAASVLAAWLVRANKKRDVTLAPVYKQLMKSKDANEIFNLFNSMVRGRYGISLKASPVGAVAGALNGAELAEKVAGVMEYMESPDARGENCAAGLKERIKGAYEIMKRERRPSV